MAPSWVVVPNLDEGRDQLNQRFPNRDKTTDGSIGNKAHQGQASSHNPDESGKPEHYDPDSKNEVRARDFDADLGDPNVTAEQVVQHIIKYARAGVFWWIRYVIYNGRIWHKRDNFLTHVYTGSNKHTGHFHITSDFTNDADEIRGTDWRFNEVGFATVPQGNWGVEQLVVDGIPGPKTITRWQQLVGTKPDGVISKPKSSLIYWVQKYLRDRVDHRLVTDGIPGPNTWRALQRYLGAPLSGQFDSTTVKALQRRLNTGKF